jgi:signal transduction histidine kinase/ActR/RegA family two-component response regulator
MKAPDNRQDAVTERASTPVRGRLFRKYVALFLAVVALALIPKGVLDIWFSYNGLRPLLVRIQTEQARSAAEKISQFVKEIENQMAWETQLPLQMRSDEEWRVDAVRLLRQVPALTEIAQLDGQGRERYRTSRQAMDVIGSRQDYSRNPIFLGALANKVYYGPVYFAHQSEPYMTIAVAGDQPDNGVIIGQVNLKFIWDVISQIKVGDHGQAYVVDGEGRLIAHPDISLVLRNVDLSQLAYVQAARTLSPQEIHDDSGPVTDLKGHIVLSAFAPVAPLRWLVFADMPIDEAYAPLYTMLVRSVLLLVAGLALAFLAGLLLAHKMIVPIRILSDGAARIGSGDLTQRMEIKTGDELEVLGDQFNNMAMQLQNSYANLEQKVEERTRELEAANLAKSRFLATASHDLRQPLHALGLFIAQLSGRKRADERKLLMTRIEAALTAMNELFNELLDVSKLDSGVMTTNFMHFPISQMLTRIDAMFAGAARENGLSMRIIPSDAWVRSDFILLERILTNLVSNAVRYTTAGRILVGCRKRDGRLHIQVWDTGVGIPQDQHKNIFVEFFRLDKHERETRSGLGLGLAIVDRLCRLLDHPIQLTSSGRGSCFSVGVPMVSARAKTTAFALPAQSRFNMSNGKLVLVVDDDPLVLEGMRGLLSSWGCRVVTASSERAAIIELAAYDHPPDVIISDYHLRGGQTGIEVIAKLCSTLSASIPAFLMSGDINPAPLREARAAGYHLLHKPIDPMMLRAALTQIVRKPPSTRPRLHS